MWRLHDVLSACQQWKWPSLRRRRHTADEPNDNNNHYSDSGAIKQFAISQIVPGCDWIKQKT